MADPDAHDTASDTDNEDFCDASEGRRSYSRPQSGVPSPPPQTQIETTVPPVNAGMPGSFADETPTAAAIPDRGKMANENESLSINGSTTGRHKPKRESVSVTKDNDDATNASGGGNNDQFGEDFDDFEVGDGNDGQDDFGDFDDAFEEPTPGPTVQDTTQDSQPISGDESSQRYIPPLLNFDSINSLPELLNATTDHLNAIFPNSSNLSSLPQPDPISNDSSIFMTERSLSLWSQLVAPPPLQPPNWTRSRVRRLFLVSLGVPVDLDEILPASKQKKLVLPSMDLEGNKKDTAPASSAGEGNSRSRSRRKKDGQQRSSRSLDTTRPPLGAQEARRRGHAPAPELDLTAARRLCATTDAALHGFTDDELRAHVAKLEHMSSRAAEVLEYWLKRRDAQRSEKDAFEGVIENLVKHARQVRK